MCVVTTSLNEPSVLTHLIVLFLSVSVVTELQSTVTQSLAGQPDPPRLIMLFATDNFSLSLVDLYHFTTHVSQRLMVYPPPPFWRMCAAPEICISFLL